MKFLQTLIEFTDDTGTKDIVPVQQKEIKKYIRTGAEDTSKKWKSALQLVEYAFKNSGVRIPPSTDKANWKILEELVHYAVQMLVEYRGPNGEWRMTDKITESEMFRVTVSNNLTKETNLVCAKDLNHLVESVKENLSGQQLKVSATVKHSDGAELIVANKKGDRKNTTVSIEVL